MYGFLAELFGWDQREGYAAVLRRHMLEVEKESAEYAEKLHAEALRLEQEEGQRRAAALRHRLIAEAESQPRPVVRQVTGVPRAKRMVEALNTAMAIVRLHREGELTGEEVLEQMLFAGWYGIMIGPASAHGSYNGIRFDLESN